VVTYETLLAVDNADLLLRPGMTATAEILVQRLGDVLLVPNAALRFSPPRLPGEQAKRGGGLVGMLLPRMPRTRRGNGGGHKETGPRVWVLRDGEPAPVSLRTGVSDGTDTQVLSGDLVAGQRVIVDSTERKGGG
jgi:HlyD family secretion protein